MNASLKVLRRKGIKVKIENGKISFQAKKVSPIHTMYERAILNVSQYSAGKALYQHWRDGCHGWLGYASCQIRERVDGCGFKEREITTKHVHAQKEFLRAKKSAKKDWDLIDRVVINELPLTRKGMGGQERAKLIYCFRRGLNDIAKCYGFS